MKNKKQEFTRQKKNAHAVHALNVGVLCVSMITITVNPLHAQRHRLDSVVNGLSVYACHSRNSYLIREPWDASQNPYCVGIVHSQKLIR